MMRVVCTVSSIRVALCTSTHVYTDMYVHTWYMYYEAYTSTTKNEHPTYT